MQARGSNPIPFMLFIFLNSKTILLKFCIYDMNFKIVYTTTIETINYKGKNPQVYLMGSNPTPRAQIVDSTHCKLNL